MPLFLFCKDLAGAVLKMLICHLLQEEVGHSYFQHCVNFQLCSTSSVSIAVPFLSLGHEKGGQKSGCTHLHNLLQPLRHAALLHTEEAREHCAV